MRQVHHKLIMMGITDIKRKMLLIIIRENSFNKQQNMPKKYFFIENMFFYGPDATTPPYVYSLGNLTER